MSVTSEDLLGIRRIFSELVESGSSIVDVFINDDRDELLIHFVDGTRLVIRTDPSAINLVSLQRTNGKGGWI